MVGGVLAGCVVAFGVTPVIHGAQCSQCFERARLKCELKMDTLATWMGITRPRLCQMLGSGDLRISKLLLLATHDDGRRFLEAFLNELSVVMGLHQWDAIASGLKQFNEILHHSMRMAKASLRRVEDDETRKSA